MVVLQPLAYPTLEMEAILFRGQDDWHIPVVYTVRYQMVVPVGSVSPITRLALLGLLGKIRDWIQRRSKNKNLAV